MLADDVRAVLTLRDPIFDGGLAALVAPVGWRRLAPAGISRDGYSTARVLADDVAVPRRCLARVPAGDAEEVIHVDAFGSPVPRRYLDMGVAESTVPVPRVEAALRSGLAVLATVPAALHAVQSLVVSFHAIGAGDPSLDVSFSDPEVPFSIFVGVHEQSVPDEALRIAEAVLHEAMHLQLSLVEDVVPLVSGGHERWLSPWQGRPRPVQGMLHAIYVFRAIHSFLSAHLETLDPVASTATYVRGRLEAISCEIAGAADAVRSEELTSDGRALMRRLLDGSASPPPAVV